MFRAHEAEHLPQIARCHDVLQERALLLDRHLVHALHDGVRRRVAPRDFDQLRLVQERVGELLDFVREGRREEQILPAHRSGQQRHDALDVGNEAHVEHAVGFVEDEDLDLAQIDRFLLHVIEKPPGCRHQDLDAAAHDGQLLLDVDAAVDHRRPESAVLAVGADRFLDLDRELARRRQDQRPDRMARRRRAGVGGRGELVQDRQGEASRLAGAGLGTAHHVLACHDQRDRLHLDRRGRGVTCFGHRTEDLRPQAERGKARAIAHSLNSWARPACASQASGPGGDTSKTRWRGRT